MPNRLPIIGPVQRMKGIHWKTVSSIGRNMGVTNDWSYIYGGNRFTESGEWVHLPAGEAGNLLLWIKSVEEAR